MCQKDEQVVLELPAGIDESKKNRTIAADKCCVDILKHLWKFGIDMRGHCCGHGECNPSIVVAENYNKAGLGRVLFLIEEIDYLKRKWDLLQWQLVKVN